MNGPAVRKLLLRGTLALYVLMVVAIFYGTSLMVLSSLNYSNAYKRVADNAADTLSYNSPDLGEMRSKRAFLEARAMLVDADSVSLTVNLADSSVTLEQKGVVLHRSKISSMRISRVFRRVHRNDLAEAFSFPLTVNGSTSTIPRKRYSMKMAPSDTSATAPMVMPDTASQEEVFFRLSMDRGIQLDFCQAEYSDHDDEKIMQNRIKRQESGRILKDMLAFKVPDYHPVIRLELPEKDARAIYKALPVNARVALRI